jgi:hypothetical protein
MYWEIFRALFREGSDEEWWDEGGLKVKLVEESIFISAAEDGGSPREIGV